MEFRVRLQCCRFGREFPIDKDVYVVPNSTVFGEDPSLEGPVGGFKVAKRLADRCAFNCDPPLAAQLRQRGSKNDRRHLGIISRGRERIKAA